MYQTPLVSVICITYNHVLYIRECLDNILSQQTGFDFEVILGEDESNDGTREICREYAERYPEKIRLFLRSRQDVIYINGGPTGRYNFIECVKAARGKYIAICEGDDHWCDAYKLQKQIDLLENHSEYVACFTRGFIENHFSGARTVSSYVEKDRELEIGDIIKANDQLFGTVVFRNEAALALPAWFSKALIGDWALYLWLLSASGKKACCLADIAAVYRIHVGGIHGHHHQSKKKVIRAYLKDLEFYKNIKNHLSSTYHKKLDEAIALKITAITKICCGEHDFKKGISINIQYLFKGLPIKTFSNNLIVINKKMVKSFIH